MKKPRFSNDVTSEFAPAGVTIDPKYARRLLKGQKQKEPKKERNPR